MCHRIGVVERWNMPEVDFDGDCKGVPAAASADGLSGEVAGR